MRNKSVKRFMAFALSTALAITSFTFGGNLTQAQAAGKTSVTLITKETNNNGDTINYSYNKKGLITKSVAKSTSKNTSYDETVTTTTTYKYDKKNRVTQKTEKTENKTTSYEVDKTTGLKRGASKGTVTNTTVADTKYTYNKKGLCTESVTTTTNGMSGSNKFTNYQTSMITRSDDDESLYELSDGKVLAGYNYYNPDGSQNYENTSANAYYLTGDMSGTENLSTITETYTDNGNGSYTVTTSRADNDNGSDVAYVDPEYAYYYSTWEYDDSIQNYKKVVYPLKKDKKSVSYNGIWREEEVYLKPDGTQVSWPSFTVTTGYTVKRNEKPSTSTESWNTVKDVTGKTVTTVKYSYDKKKRVKKEVATIVETSGDVSTTTYAHESTSASFSRKNSNVRKSESARENTSVVTTTYTYDKKGRAKKVVTTDDGKAESKETSSDMTVSSSIETVYYNADGSVSSTSTRSETYSAYPETEMTVVTGGVETSTTVYNPYVYTETEKNVSGTYTNDDYVDTHTVSYYANGGRKEVVSHKDNKGGTTVDTTSYRFDPNGVVTGETQGTEYVWYDDGQRYYTTDESKTKIAAAEAAMGAPSVYTKVNWTEAALAQPSKDTTNYSYDSKGNLTSAKSTGTSTSIDEVLNETYGNQIYEFDAAGKLKEKKVATTHKYTDKDTYELTTKKVKKKKLTQILQLGHRDSDNAKANNYSMRSHRVFTTKTKKFASATGKIAKKQQWSIRNGNLNGEVVDY